MEGDPTYLDLARTSYPALRANIDTPGRPLTEEIMRKASDAWLRGTPNPHGTEKNPHMVNSAAYDRGGWTLCAACLSPVLIPKADE